MSRTTSRKQNRGGSTGNDDIWFPAKRFGYGWGLPVAWQGWAVVVTYVLLAIVVATSPATQSPLVFFSAITLLTIALLVICHKKGVKPRWRWGDDKDQ